MKSAARVGFLLIVFVVLIVGSYAILGRNLFVHKHNILLVRMKDAAGIVEGTKVLMAGVQVGTVQKVGLANPHEALLTLAILKQVQIPIGTKAVVPGSLIGFGDSQLTLVAPMDFTGNLPSLAEIQGIKAGPLDSILPDGGKTLYGNINDSLKAVQSLLKDQGLQKNFKQLLTTANETLLASQQSLVRFNALSDRASNLIVQNQGNLHSVVVSMQGTLEQVHYTASTLADFVKQGKLQNGSVAILNKATKIEDQASGLLAQLNKISSDPSLKKDLDSTLHNAALTSAKGPEIADNAQKITQNMAEITDKSKKLPDTINEVASKASTLEDKLSSLIDKFNGVKAPNTSGLKDFRTELDLTREANPGYWRTDLNVTYPLKEGYITFGLYDAFETDRLNLELAKPVFSSLNLRYGIYASKPAIGVDWNLTRKLSVRGDLWNINSPELDARLRYDFGGGFVGWAGVDRAFSHTAPIIGIGVVR